MPVRARSHRCRRGRGPSGSAGGGSGRETAARGGALAWSIMYAEYPVRLSGERCALPVGPGERRGREDAEVVDATLRPE